MDLAWRSEFRARMRSFELQRPPRLGEVSVSVKVRVVSGCFHREHSPRAYARIDKHLVSGSGRKPEFAFVEHESGPELLTYLGLGAAGVALAKSVIDLIVTIIKARTEGVKEGDHAREPIEIIVRRVGDGDRFVEEKVLRIGHADQVDRAEIEARISDALKRPGGSGSAKAAKPAVQRTRRKASTRPAASASGTISVKPRAPVP